MHVELINVLNGRGLLKIDLASKLHRLSLTNLNLLLLSVLIMTLRSLFPMLLTVVYFVGGLLVGVILRRL